MRQSQYSKALTIALPPEHFERIKQITDDNQTSMAQWVREAVAVALKTAAEENPDLKF
jgi:predicted DNA-binding protein